VAITGQVTDKGHADRLVKFLKEIGATRITKTEKSKTFTVKFTEPKESDHIQRYLMKNAAKGRQALNEILRGPQVNSSRRILELLSDGKPSAVALRKRVIAIARKKLPDFPRSDS
jgi:hypothetical protein